MKHVEQIKFEGDDGTYGVMAGFCRELNSHVLRTMSGWIYDYCVYYQITEEEYGRIMESLEAINRNEIHYDQVVPEIHGRLVGAGFKRAYDINPHFPDGCDPYTYTDAPYLLDEGVFYFHLYYGGRHYAAVPRRMEWVEGKKVHPYRELPGVRKHMISFEGKEVFLCYGYEIKNFDGMEEWEVFHKKSIEAGSNAQKL